MQQRSSNLVGIAWFVFSLIVSNINDILSKYVSISVPTFEVVFLRFFFSTLSLLPVIFWLGYQYFYTASPMMHLTRSIILFIATSTWTYGLQLIPISTSTLITFTIPMFVLLISIIFLKEKINMTLWLATVLGFIGSLIALELNNLEFNALSLLMLVSSALFASLDVINKIYIVKENILTMLFYPVLLATIFGIIPASQVWHPINLQDILLLATLGINSNVILFCLLKAFQVVKASTTAPYRYLELIISIALGYIVFHEIPSYYMALGAICILPTMYLSKID